jgi:hypothetical protein
MLNKIRKSTWFLLIVIVITSMISIQGYKIYVSEPKIEIVNQFWSDYSKVYENALNATLETYCNDDATIMIQNHINEETHKLVQKLKDVDN